MHQGAQNCQSDSLADVPLVWTTCQCWKNNFEEMRGDDPRLNIHQGTIKHGNDAQLSRKSKF